LCNIPNDPLTNTLNATQHLGIFVLFG
jgi:hypothetical protein